MQIGYADYPLEILMLPVESEYLFTDICMGLFHVIIGKRKQKGEGVLARGRGSCSHIPSSRAARAGPPAPFLPHTFTRSRVSTGWACCSHPIPHFHPGAAFPAVGTVLWGQCMGPCLARGHCSASSATSSRGSFNYTSGQFVSMSARVQRWEWRGERYG